MREDTHIQTIFVLSRGRIRRRRNGIVSVGTITIRVLVRQPELAGSTIAEGVRSGEPLDIGLLRIIKVEELALTNAT